jgi:hypothetical protein
MWAVVSFLLLFHPSLSPKPLPGRNRTQYHLFPDTKGEIIDKLAWEIAALMTARNSLRGCTGSDWTIYTVFEQNIGQAAFAFNILGAYEVDILQSFFEFRVIVLMCNVDATYSAV